MVLVARSHSTVTWALRSLIAFCIPRFQPAFEWMSQGFCCHGLSVVHSTASPNSTHHTTTSHHIACPHNLPHSITTTPLHHFTSDHMTSHQITPCDRTSHQSHHTTSHHTTWHDMTSRSKPHCLTSQPTTLLRLTSQPTTWHHTTSHHHHGNTTSHHQNTTPRRKGWRLVCTKNSVWAAHQLVALRTFYRQILLWLVGSFPLTSATGLSRHIIISVLHGNHVRMCVYICIYENHAYKMCKPIPLRSEKRSE